MILLLFLLAQAPIHPAPPPAKSPEEACTRQCHVKHCDEYTACAEMTEPGKCAAEANRHESECFKRCSQEKV